MREHINLLRPDADASKAPASWSSFPSDLLVQSAIRLRILALLYAFVFFMAAIFPMLLTPADRAELVGSFIHWGPSVISIAVALLVVAAISSARISVPALMNIGLLFEVVGRWASVRETTRLG
jgi:hypothetical protein